jgi:deazaflavin-dependent oxidoreductase (nitroreductase family)
MRFYRAFFIRLGRTAWFTWLSINLLVPMDRFVYRRSGGRFSLLHFGRARAVLPTLLLTTTGRKSRAPRTTPVLYMEDGGSIVVMASNFGQQRHPAWSGNLLANPEASIRIGTSLMDVRARLASDEEKARFWPMLLDIYPTWEAYTHRTDREFRAFVLEPKREE